MTAVDSQSCRIHGVVLFKRRGNSVGVADFGPPHFAASSYV